MTAYHLNTVAGSNRLITDKMAFLGKEYSCVKQENVEAFFKFIGVPEDKLAAYCDFAPSGKLVKDGDSYTFTSQYPSGPKVVTFQSGVEFEDSIGIEKVPIKSTYVVDGNTVTQTIKSTKGTTIFKREFSGDDMVLTMTNNDWDGVAKRYYKA
ncbi:fatty acid-binding protein 2-like [Anticarsia gemmatalis]|uniref:fatty acid-binding protein 2-like n=1 Tax=Anticarsia gemmatalis TaxID=129554 RepID=UPI003F773DB0